MFIRLTSAAAVLVIGISGCAGPDVGTSPQNSVPGLPTSAAAPTQSIDTAPDYRRLLLTAGDLSDDEDTFLQRSIEAQPDGQDGAAAFFVNEHDNRAISDTVLVYQDAQTATATLRQASGSLATLVQGGTPVPFPVGTDGTVISGTSPDGTKAVTLVLFTEGRALVKLEFQSAKGDATTDGFVTSIAKMQQIAIRNGLSDSE